MKHKTSNEQIISKMLNLFWNPENIPDKEELNKLIESIKEEAHEEGKKIGREIGYADCHYDNTGERSMA